jgi:hypothetical protein
MNDAPEPTGLRRSRPIGPGLAGRCWLITARKGLPWIQAAPDAPYFVTETGEPWTPIGQNDAITWPELAGLFRGRDLPAVEAHLRWLADHGVTCLRLMLEYAQVRHRYFERPIGRPVPAMVTLWDTLFALCERVGMRILLTPFDTFWMWRHWKWHPYNRRHGGCLGRPSQLLTSPAARVAIKERLRFVVERWGGSGALFAWDLWNEIHPAQAGDSADCFGEFIADLSRYVRALETRLYGRSHPQTVSLFGPELDWRPHMPLKEPIFRHPDLDFASIHIYEEGTIDFPRNTVDPALGVGRIVRAALAEISDNRPFLDSEHGPIHTFKDHHIILPEPFDDEYFRHMQWAHLASGGAGGGMRWPNRHPHVLTKGMRRAQAAMAGFLPLIDWARFRRVNLNAEIEVSTPAVAAFGCADEAQAVIWLVRRDTIGADGMLDRGAAPIGVRVRIPGLAPRPARAVLWDTTAGAQCGVIGAVPSPDGVIVVQIPALATDLALAVRTI